MIGAFYLFPPILGLRGRVHAPDLYVAGRTDALLLDLPGRLPQPSLGEAPRTVTAAGTFAAFMPTTSGLLVAVAGALAHDQFARTFHPGADQRARLLAFRAAALAGGTVASALGLQMERFHINMWWAGRSRSPVAPSSRCWCWAIWWRGLTAGTLLGGTLTPVAIVYTMATGGGQPQTVLATLLAQPAIWSIPTAFGTIVLVLLLTRERVPADVNLRMPRLHVPESLGLRTGCPDYRGRPAVTGRTGRSAVSCAHRSRASSWRWRPNPAVRR